ncbi:similar to Saccharomyces cerevisiae YNL166C BNI5 Protein involved in organization of septins at the mother-bud neck [Maudiozyma saulgeensis]|uniref:Similar to Saccharomyces cerevisiae YNL166C BNI5 Protein involved in organization of septins at the mother-bud neck n=1 Tax=Maudiozyma saulgeensis TaxID=1789683 RepID=A0A1X7R2C8_9SACH|nr:similar to Saccharomyces cerevisiae YNL166C BNI5 Protein involved in organization of septins at the mother-bud neck [Kazachstania saulgeensis]
MGLDQEKIKKRLSQIELDIDKMNQMIDDNLQLGTTDDTMQEQVAADSNDDAEDEKIESEVKEVVAEVVKAPVHLDSMYDSQHEGLGEPIKVKDSKIDEATQTQEEEPVNETPLEKVVSAAKSIASAAEEMVDTSIDAAVGPNEEEEEEEEIANTSLEKVISAAKSVGSAAEEMINNSLDIAVDPVENEDTAVNQNDRVLEVNETSVKKIVNSIEEVNNAPETMINETVDTPVDTHVVSQLKPDDDEWEEITEENVETVGKETDTDENTSKIVLPKHTGHNTSSTPTIADDKMIERITSKRLPSRPFRVISVGSANSSATERNISPIPAGTDPEESTLERIEQRYDYLTNKTTKLTKEISYLTGMVSQGNLSIDDSKRLKVALTKLQEYLDRKTKERYETGVLLSRQLRKQIDKGENGQFWVGNK